MMMSYEESGSSGVLKDKTNVKMDSSKPVVGVRSLEIADELAERAKINLSEMMPIVQGIRLTSSISSEEYRLLEVDQEKLAYLLDGHSMVIRGDVAEHASCCTNDSTHSFKVAEISNPLLVTSNLLLPANIDSEESHSFKTTEVVFLTNKYFIMTKERPRLQKLRNLLEFNLYCGKAIDQNCSARKYTVDDFLENIQASETEIYEYLNFIEAYKIDGYWRLLDSKFYSDMSQAVISLVEEASWPWDSVPVEEVYSILGDLYGAHIINQFVKYYFEPRADDANLYAIKKEKYCHFMAEQILKSTIKLRYNEFQLILRKTLPMGFDYDYKIEHIQDICYIDEPYIYYLNFLDLPDDIEKRLRVLFEKRKRWSYEELQAFLRDLCGNNITELNNALTKYCRSFSQNNSKYFTSRI